jgi:two-component system sensor histidine kinase RegB
MHAASPLHLQGMWVAYVLAASFVAYFVSRVAAALRERERQMDALQRHVAVMKRVAALSTMAAGAAHELGTPLASIAVSAAELARALSRHEGWASFAGEARHIREEVARCRGILDRLAMGSGQPAGEAPALLSVSEIVQQLCDELGPAHAAALDVDDALSARRVRCPPRALVHALKNLITNGIDAGQASHTQARVTLRVRARGSQAMFEVSDRGAGIPDEVRARLGEPFFTTKPIGAGMGLGLYLVRSFVQQVGGELSFASQPGVGARVTLTLAEGALEGGAHE